MGSVPQSLSVCNVDLFLVDGICRDISASTTKLFLQVYVSVHVILKLAYNITVCTVQCSILLRGSFRKVVRGSSNLAHRDHPLVVTGMYTQTVIRRHNH